MVGDLSGGDEDKENQSRNANSVSPQKEEDKVPIKGFPEPEKVKKELTEEEKEALAKQREEEYVQKILERSKTQKQMSFLNLRSDVFKIY